MSPKSMGPVQKHILFMIMRCLCSNMRVIKEYGLKPSWRKEYGLFACYEGFS